MPCILYYSRNPNPRLAVAVARHVRVPVTFEWCAPFDPAERARFLALNPWGRIPILVEDGRALWEADAIACRLSQRAGSAFWRTGAALPDMIRWISWGKETFVRACDMVHFERGTKQRYGLGPVDPALIAEGLALFHEAAALLEAELAGRDWLMADGLSYADFRMATFLPFNDVAGLPLAEYPHLSAWAARLQALPFWADPFGGLDAPALPPVAGEAAP
ncbi:glutathione S-transferase family protein [Pseudotabrizicola algicola]|uniref:Glutathione S-transferase family protein n=1 Tax=Pseudotabrizicola algicola TaxID=2709381 RepID=A0A6B3RSK2_9RHOB|nr:glutathione S-transferase family protein [Pseudotabrizicola algicola]NEX48491.1 glutathione S-transferase family protein [Pseudotabrizicola algicola]